jgi:hypothetical protein
MTNQINAFPATLGDYYFLDEVGRVENHPEKEQNAVVSATELTPIPKSPQVNFTSYFKDFGLMTALTLGGAAFDLGVCYRISKVIAKYGFCLGNFISNGVRNNLNSIVNSIVDINDSVSSLFGSNIASQIMAPAFLENVELWVVQNVLLRKLPKKMIEKISPTLGYLVDTLPARITRVAATAILFAVLHVNVLECEHGGGIHQLLGGILYGTLLEFTDNVTYGINLHIAHNLLVYFLHSRGYRFS